MSGTSRIGGGYGGYSGGGGQRDRSASLARFTKGRKVGDVVSGTFLRMETESLGWALLEGEELLAHFPSDGPAPAPGDKLFFIIDALVPEVVLRKLRGGDPLATLALLVPVTSMGQEAALYTKTRDRLDEMLAARRGRFVPLPDDPAERRKAFAARVARESSLFTTFTETVVRARALRRIAAPAGLVFFQHMPWISESVSGLEVSLWERNESPIFATAVLPNKDRLVLRGTMESGRLRYKLGVLPAKGGVSALPGRLSSVVSSIAEYRGVDLASGRLAPGQTADVVGRILALAVDSGSSAVGRFSRKL